MRYRIPSGVRAYIESTADWCSRELRNHLPALLEALNGGHGDIDHRLSAVAARTPLGQAFTEARDESSRWALPERIVFPPSAFPLRARFWRDGEGLSILLSDAEAWRSFAGLFCDDGAQRVPNPFLDRLLGGGYLESCGARKPRRHLKPGIYRLQHAAALIVGETSRILIDPVHFMDPGDPIRPDVIGDVDAIVLSHGHGDHVCPLTLAHYHRDTPVLLYDSMGGSMLCADLSGILIAAGFRDVREISPGETSQFGDVAVTARRFVGEQPWVTIPPPADRLRTHGLTWIFELNGQRIWFLVDSGFEYEATMIEEAGRVVEQFGQIDIIAANMREFPWYPGQIDGSGRYLFCFPRDELFEPGQWPHRRLITLGIDGVGRVAAIVGARCVLPHAHWFQPPGAPVLVDRREPETSILDRVRLAATADFETPAWCVGDAIMPLADGGQSVRRQAFAL